MALAAALTFPGIGRGTAAAAATMPPTVTAISPSHGPVAGGTTVTVTGTAFTGATAVKFGAVAATSYTVASDTTLTAVSPAQSASIRAIEVTSKWGTSTAVAASNFTYVRPPTTGNLTGVSCPSTTWCVAVGSPGGRLGSGTQGPLVEVRTSTGWRVVTVPAPAGAAGLAAVSCPSTNSCVAVGTTGQDGYADIWDGTSWTTVNMAMPTGSKGSVAVNGVSCAAVNNCVAVGDYTDPDYYNAPFSETWNGSSWTQVAVPLPANDGQGYLDGISCPTTTMCMAVGQASADYSQPLQPLAERYNGSAWAVVPTAVTANITGLLDAVSCSTPSYCVAGGLFNAQTQFAEVWNGSSWAVNSPSISSGSSAPVLTGVSCSSATACVSTGSIEDNSGTANTLLAAKFVNNAWTVSNPAAPSGVSSGFAAISCVSSTFCIAVGYTATSSPGTASEVDLAVGEYWNGSKWALAAT